MHRAIIVMFMFLFGLAHVSQSQSSPVRIFAEQAGERQIKIFGNNSGYCPYSVDLNIKKQNMIADKSAPYSFVLPPRTDNQLLVTLEAKMHREASYSMSSIAILGDIHARHDASHVYRLPFPEGDAFLMSQGYDGRFSHDGIRALDFTMPVGTQVCAARDGIVAEVREDSDRGCKSSRCREDANFIIIWHADGSFAEYVHLKKNGSLVKPGDRIAAGQVIGYSGNTGWSSGPHLHFSVFVARPGKRKTEPVRFWVNGEAQELKEGTVYENPEW